MFGLLILVGPVAFLAALLAVPVVYLAWRPRPASRKRAAFLRYLLRAAGAGAAGYLAGAAAGILVACRPEDAGNLCGLAGVFGAGPLLSAVAIGVYCYKWAVNARSGPAS